MKRNAFLLALLLLIATPALAWANAGSPVMIAGALHLLFGNFLIGVVEGLALGLCLFACPARGRSRPFL